MYHEINITTYDRFCVSAISNGCGTKREDRKTAPDLGNCI